MAGLLHVVAHHFIHIHGLDVLFGHDTGIDKAVVQADVAGSLGLLHEEHLQALLGAAARGDGAGDTRADNEHIGVDGFGYLVSIDGCGGSEERGLSRGGEVVATCRAAIRPDNRRGLSWLPPCWPTPCPPWSNSLLRSRRLL